LWFDLSAADPIYVLPVLFGVVMAAFVRLQQQNKRRWVLPLVFVLVITALVWESRAGVQLYLMASLGLMALQTILQRRWLGRQKRVAAARPAPLRFVPLQAAGQHADLGNKAVRLGCLLEAGLPVPPGSSCRRRWLAPRTRCGRRARRPGSREPRCAARPSARTVL
jgi:hypothetical protein